MKIVVTISEFGAAANLGGDVERRSAVIDIPDDQLPVMLQQELQYRAEAREADGQVWTSISFSLLEEPTP